MLVLLESAHEGGKTNEGSLKGNPVILSKVKTNVYFHVRYLIHCRDR